MKKASTKTTKAPVTAPKAKDVAKKTVAVKKPTAVKKAAVVKAAPTKVAKKPALVVTPRSAAPAVKASSKKAVSTVITALVDVGFGNTLYLRGEGVGINWDSGVALECNSENKWEIALPAASKPLIFKFLINDSTWSAGADYVCEPGSSVTLTPTF